MPPTDDFGELISRARGGDEAAATALFERYHKVLYRTVALRLQNSGLQAVADGDDVCQTVFKSFFVRLRLGQYELGSGGDLVNLLLRMAHNKVSDRRRRQQARPDQANRVGEVDGERTAGREATPSQVLTRQELLGEALRRLSEEEQQMLRLRDEGLGWDEVAGQLGGTAEGRRKQWERARQRVAEALRLED